MEIKKLENSSVELTLTLEAKKIEDEYSKQLNDYAKKLTVKGFRPGKAPVSLIEKKYGDAIREEVTFKLMEENLKDSYKDMDEKDRPLPYSTPVLQNEEALMPFKPNTDVTYSVIYDVLPEVKLPQYTGLDIEYTEAKVSDEDVNAEIEKLRQQNAMVIAKNGPIAEGDIVTMDYAELDADGNPIEATKRDDFTFTVGSSYNFYKLDSEVIGLEKGAETVIEKTYGDDSGMGTDYLGKTVKIKVAIKEVKVRELPELDDEFAQDVKEEYETVKDLTDATRKELQAHADEENSAVKLESALDAILAKTEIALPASMVEAELEQEWKDFVKRFGGVSENEIISYLTANGGGKEQFLDTRRASVEKTLKSQLILEQIKKEQNYKASDEEIEEEVKKFDKDLAKDNPNYEVYKMYAEDSILFDKAKNYLIENNNFKAVEKKAEASDEAKASDAAKAEN
jgi:trigger factor